jgi:hypothetical protein
MPTPESLARHTIDHKLTAAGWIVQTFTAVSFIYRLVKFAGAIKRPPYNLTPEDLWRAYERLDKSRVRAAGPSKLLTEVISLVSVADETEKELDGALVRAERLRGAACPASAVVRDVEVRVRREVGVKVLFCDMFG